MILQTQAGKENQFTSYFDRSTIHFWHYVNNDTFPSLKHLIIETPMDIKNEQFIFGANSNVFINNSEQTFAV